MSGFVWAWIHVRVSLPNISVSLYLNRKWCTRWPVLTVIIVWVDLQRTVIPPVTLIYVAHSPTNSIPLLQPLACSCPLRALPLCRRACTKPWHVKCKTPRTTSSLRQWGSVVMRLRGPMAQRRKRVWWSQGGEGGHRGPQSQLVIVQVLDVRLEQLEQLGSKPAQGGPSEPPKQRDIRSAPADPLAASRALLASRSLTLTTAMCPRNWTSLAAMFHLFHTPWWRKDPSVSPATKWMKQVNSCAVLSLSSAWARWGKGRKEEKTFCLLEMSLTKFPLYSVGPFILPLVINDLIQNMLFQFGRDACIWKTHQSL